MHAPRARHARAFASIALLCFAGGLAAAALPAALAPPPVTAAGLFGPPVLDLVLGPEGKVDGFLARPNLAPGDRASGTLRLSSASPLPRAAYDLDVAVGGNISVAYHFQPPLDLALHVARLSYGRDDLLSSRDGGRDALRELDTNRDGNLTLRELRGGIRDLPPPLAARDGGTPFAIELVFRPPPDADGATYRGQRLTITFTFRLADSLDTDLLPEAAHP